MTYVCYDIKGIQRFIFSVPKLKCIVGGSSLIDTFDNESENEKIGTWIYSGGGKGAFHCSSDEEQALVESLRKRAHDVGLDIQFGIDESSLREASRSADEFYPYVPPTMTKYPCALSGLLPAKNKGQVNEKIQLRLDKGREDSFGKRLRDSLRERLPERLRDRDVEFFRSVSSDADEEGTEQYHANAACNAMGRSNRWAVIAMDGNDIGSQYGVYAALSKDDAQLINWQKTMSNAMKRCTHEAVISGILAVIDAWLKDTGDTALGKCTYDAHDGKRMTVLPLRPLILGGDDVVLLCHSAYAFEFVQVVAEGFAQESIAEAEKARPDILWPASGNALSISAGVLFCNLHMPLHTAIPYAEELLKNAKRAYRQKEIPDKREDRRPTSAAIDFEVVTDSLLDTPSERRSRELIFDDPELGGRKISLTRRPYRLFDNAQSTAPVPRSSDTWTELNALADQLNEIPTSVRAQFLPNMRRPWSERVEFMASLAKRYPAIVEIFGEGFGVETEFGSGWSEFDGRRECGIADASILLEEEKRVTQQTT